MAYFENQQMNKFIKKFENHQVKLRYNEHHRDWRRYFILTAVKCQNYEIINFFTKDEDDLEMIISIYNNKKDILATLEKTGEIYPEFQLKLLSVLLRIS
jgi:hypothetical protein